MIPGKRGSIESWDKDMEENNTRSRRGKTPFVTGESHRIETSSEEHSSKNHSK